MLYSPTPKTCAFLALTREPGDPDALSDLFRLYPYPPAAAYRIAADITGAPVYRCAWCSDLCNDHHGTDTDDGTVCASCRDDAFHCDQCERTMHADDIAVVLHDSCYCQRCADRHLTSCESCGDYVDQNEAYHLSGYGDYCEGCYSDVSRYCEECGEDYHYSDSDEHEHGCHCEAPNRRFTFPNNGAGTVRDSTLFTVTLPSGIVSDEGIAAIAAAIDHEVNAPYREARETYYLSACTSDDYAAMQSVPHIPVSATLESVGPEWQSRRGNMTRRISSAFYKDHGLRLSQALISKVGNLARQHSASTAAYNLKVTRDLNGPASDYYHEDSCWFQSYYRSRCALKQWGGIGLLSYNANGTVTGRVWVQPLTAYLTPTHDATGAAAYIVYNGYGDLEGYAPARILAHLTGMTYRKVRFTAAPQYVNSDSGFLVAPADVLDSTDALHISNDDEHHTYDHAQHSHSHA